MLSGATEGAREATWASEGCGRASTINKLADGTLLQCEERGAFALPTNLKPEKIPRAFYLRSIMLTSFTSKRFYFSRSLPLPVLFEQGAVRSRPERQEMYNAATHTSSLSPTHRAASGFAGLPEKAPDESITNLTGC